MSKDVTYTLEIHHDSDHGYEAAVKELPGCFAAGATLDELHEAVIEAIQQYHSGPGVEVTVRRVPDGEVVEERSTFELCYA
jgi:predicted RNase H-like HicB family nuclease